MQVAILSLILNTNYGGILQAYALQTTLERLGHNVKVIDRVFIPDLPIKQQLTTLPKRFVQKYVLRRKMNFWPERHFEHQRYLERSQYTREFIFDNLHIRKCRALKRLRAGEFDAIVVGSDQVWRPSYFCGWGPIRDSFLHFARKWDVTRISYAASFGTDKWEFNEDQTREAQELIRKFKAVSVREADGIRLCNEKLGVEAEQVFDPTLLLERADYEKLIAKRETPAIKGTLLNYILDDTPEKSGLIDTIAKDKNLTPFRINDTEDIRRNDVRQPVEAWLKAFRDAEFVVTDSFHACVFSVIFHKPFICLGNKARGLSRFVIFSNDLCLNKNIISDVADYDSAYDYTPTEATYSKIAELKEKSILFLKNNLT